MLDAASRCLRLGVEHLGGENYRRVPGALVGFRSAAELFLGNAGTAFRPLTAALALSGGDYILKGVARMRRRPIGNWSMACVGLSMTSPIWATRVILRCT